MVDVIHVPFHLHERRPDLGDPRLSVDVAPFDPARPAPANNGLNSNYRYAGYTSTYRPDAALWCHQDGPTLRCKR